MSAAATGTDPLKAYWDQLVLLKVVACYVRRYRDEQAWWINRLGLFKAVVTSGTIGAWAVWKDYAFIWGILLGATQILDAAKEYLPQTRNRQSASEFVSALDSLIIDARFEWFAISAGQYQAAEIMDRWRKLAKLRNETEAKYFPDGLPANPDRQKLAEAEARAYFFEAYGVGGTEHG
jgi:hypothetical protein